MVTLDKELHKKAHKELHQAIYDCKCKPYLEPWKYCDNCKNAMLKFMDEHGAGVLTRDEEIEELAKLYSKALKLNASLEKRLDEKIKRVEELKARIKSSGISLTINSDIFDDV